MTKLVLYILLSCVLRYPKYFQKCSPTEFKVLLEITMHLGWLIFHQQ